MSSSNPPSSDAETKTESNGSIVSEVHVTTIPHLKINASHDYTYKPLTTQDGIVDTETDYSKEGTPSMARCTSFLLQWLDIVNSGYKGPSSALSPSASSSSNSCSCSCPSSSDVTSAAEITSTTTTTTTTTSATASTSSSSSSSSTSSDTPAATTTHTTLGIVDLRDSDVYAKQHIIGSTNIPWRDYVPRAHELPPRGVPLALVAPDAEVLQAMGKFIGGRGYPVTFSTIDDNEFFWQVCIRVLGVYIGEWERVSGRGSALDRGSERMHNPSICLTSSIPSLCSPRRQLRRSRLQT
eukprot:TRINITY_DN1393_c1_g1_i2.p1 TRINITY_DN1393_c1_g1~~TRINITY_DN1393_c1_g1_i2.p1  ORF type:complete len:312 (+),score=49.08 TRINITY_DN1393_c1_g1_i2:51-938(+)